MTRRLLRRPAISRTRRRITGGLLASGVVVVAALGQIAPVGATVTPVNQLPFELDGNTATNGAPTTVDWDAFFNPSGGGTVPGATAKATLPAGFVTADFKADWSTTTAGAYNTADPSTYATGSKDTLGVGNGGWQCKASNNVGNKVDITNFYVTAYKNPANNDLIAYFGMEKFGSNGTNDIGVWFMGDPNADCSSAGGTVNFSGHHSNNDVLLLSEFTSGGGTSTVEAFIWRCTSDGTSTGTPLSGLPCDNQGTLITGPKVGNVTQGVVDGSGCLPSGQTLADPRLCAITNSGTLNNVPWLTASSGGVDHSVPTVQFYEGGIDLTAITGSSCVARAIGDTRSSASPTATLFDFASEPFSVCHPSTSLTKTSDAALVNGVPTVHVNQSVTYTYRETNTGTDPLTNVSVTDDKCAPVNPTNASNGYNVGDSTTAGTLGVLDPGETWTYTCSTSYSASGSVTNTAVASGTDALVGNATITWCADANNPPAGTICSQNERAQYTVTVINPGTSLTKVAAATSTATGTQSSLVIHSGDTVYYTYRETNSGDAALTNVSVTDDRCSSVNPTNASNGFNIGDSTTTGTLGKLDPGETWTFTCSTTVSAGPTGTGVPPTVTNVALASGTDPLGNTIRWCNASDLANPPAGVTCSQGERATATVTVIHPATVLSKTVNHSTIENGGSVTYTYHDQNTGDAALSNPSVSDDKCSSVLPTNASNGFNVGDSTTTGTLGKLDPGETFTYTCTTTLSAAQTGTTPPSITNTATGHGTDVLGFDVTYCADPANPGPNIVCSQGEQATASVTLLHPGIAVTKGLQAVVTYTYTETNTGDTVLTRGLSDDKCATIAPVLGADNVHNIGDSNANGVFDPGEAWQFTCQQTLTYNGTPIDVLNTATATGTDSLSTQVSAMAHREITIN